MLDENFRGVNYLLHCITARSPHIMRVLIIMKHNPDFPL